MNLFYKITLFLFLIIGPSSIYAKVIDCDKMAGDDFTDNSKAFNACLAAAVNEPEKTVKIPVAVKAYKMYSEITIPAYVTVVGDKGSKLNAELDLSNYSKIFNIEFSDRNRVIGIGEDEWVTGAEVRNCTFGKSSTYSIVQIVRGNDCIIDNNVFNNQKGSAQNKPGHNIQILGGKRNKITNNYTNGGKTGIGVKYDRAANGGGYESLIEDTYVYNNTCENYLEEGISFDVVGNSSTQGAYLEYDTVKSAKNSSITLSHSVWETPPDYPSYIGYDMVFLSGEFGGATLRIIAQSNGTFTLDSSVSGVVAGDEIVIGATFKRNIIEKNTVKGPSNSCILIFGMGFNNIIRGNIIPEGSISVRSLDDTFKSDQTVTNECGRAPSGYNLIEGNIVTLGNINLFYRDNTTTQCQTSRPPYYSFGNSVVNNAIGGRLFANYQYYHKSGNTGSVYEENANTIPLPLIYPTNALDQPKNVQISPTVTGLK